MKKLFALILGLTITLAACGLDAPEGPPPTERPVQLANPYVTCADAAEMQQQAGLEVSLPTQLPEWVTETIYRAMPGRLVEVIYAGGDNEIRVRIANGSEDISGVYDSDTREEKDVTLEGQSIHLKGETQASGEFIVLVATWTTEAGRTYSVTSTQGVPEDGMLQCIAEIQ